MKKNTLMLALVSGILLMAGAAVQAQSSRTTRASIPFDFAANDVTMKAGDYTIRKGNAETMVLSGTDTKSQVFVLAQQKIVTSEEGRPMRLIFQRYGNSYFLSEIWTNANSGVRLRPSKNERAIAKDLAKQSQRAQTVEVALAR